MRRLLALLLLAPLAAPTLAAESYDGCAGFIDALPATISTQGTWCLRKDLSTAVTSGAAITIATNNVTIDCNGFKLGGLAAGPTSEATGVYATGRLNATVRHCAIRGFHAGVRLTGSNSAGHLVEDNRIDQSLAAGIVVSGDGNLVQRNRIFDTGLAGGNAAGIVAAADIRDNTIEGAIGESILGINVDGVGNEVRGNRLRDLDPGDSGFVDAIITTGPFHSIVDNRIINALETTSGVAIMSGGTKNSFCRDNLIAGYGPTPIYQCEDYGGNAVH